MPQSPAPTTSYGMKRRSGICDEPARNGAIARTSPTKRPIRIALPPWRSKKRSTCSSRSCVIFTRGPWRSMNPRPRRRPM